MKSDMSSNVPDLQLRSLSLENYWGIKKATIDFHPELTVLIGRNGSGKTSILDALAKAFRLLEVNLRSGDTKVDPASFFSDRDIHNEANAAELRISAFLDFEVDSASIVDEETFVPSTDQRAGGKVRTKTKRIEAGHGGDLDWGYLLTRSGHQVDKGSRLDDLYRLVEYINYLVKHEETEVKQQATLPIAVFYPCSRASDISMELQGNRARNGQPSIFDAWEDALTEDSFAYEAFFTWFRRAYGNKAEGDATESERRQFEVVSQAILKMFGEDENESEGVYFEGLGFSWRRSLEGEITIKKRKGPDIRLSQLSSGERVLLLLAADLSRRLVIANPHSTNPLRDGAGTVMIDEVGLHLHPSWQRKVIDKLRGTFENIQFIVTTHSPQVLQNVKREHVRLLKDGEVQDYQPFVEGRDANSILEDAFGLRKRLADYEKKVDHIYRLMDADDFTQAEKELNELKQQWGEDDLEINRMQNYLELYS